MELTLPNQLSKNIPPNGASVYVVTFSGGKDSVATWLHLERERGLRVICVMADTGWEAESTYAYVRSLEADYGCPLVMVRPRLGHLWESASDANLTSAVRLKLDLIRPGLIADGVIDADAPGNPLLWPINMKRLILMKGRPPSPTARFCTTILKLRPCRDAVLALRQTNRVVIATGIRDEESEKRKNTPRMLIDDLTGVPRWNPIKHWTADEVFAIHKRFGVPPNPLYLRGCSRVGCWPCIFSRKAELAVFSRDAGGVARLKDVGAESQQTFFAEGKVATAYRSDIHNPSGKRINWADDVIRWALSVEPALKKDGLFVGEHEDYDAGDDILAEVCSSVYGLCE
jgi:3'-phosphoadenosine 5'-phosphosulfate sulfotransferase (PAPS reductase)/FAD synthetase